MIPTEYKETSSLARLDNDIDNFLFVHHQNNNKKWNVGCGAYLIISLNF